MGLSACLMSAACVPDPGGYYGGVQPAYDGYAQPNYLQPSYVPPGYAEPGYLVPDGPRYVQPYGYAVPVTPGFGYGYGRGRDPGFRDREFRRDFQDRGERERRFRDNPGAFDRGRFEGRNFERPRPPEPPRQQPGPPPGQTPPLPGGIFPGVPRPMPR